MHISGIYIVGNNHQVGIIIGNDIDNTLRQSGCQSIRRRITRIDNKGSLNRRILQYIQIFFLILPGMISVTRHFQRMYFRYIKQITDLFGYFYIRSKDRSKQDDLVSFIQQEVLLKRVEDVTHGSRTALGGKQIEFTFGRLVVAQCLIQIITHQYFRIFQNTVGNRILVTDHTFCPLMYQVVFINILYTYHIIIGIT